MKRTRAMTLIELVIYIFLFVVVLSLVLRTFVFSRRTLEKPAAAFSIQQDLLALQKTLRRDLEETRLSTVRIYPNPSHPDAKPGISFASARGLADDEIKTTPNGTPYWQKIVYYYLENDPDTPETSRLIRKEGVISGLPAALPAASTYIPESAPFDNRRKRVAGRHIMSPKEKIPVLNKTLGDQGGFEVSFMDDEGNTSKTDFMYHPLVTVNLTAMNKSASTGKPTVMELQIRAKPEN